MYSVKIQRIKGRPGWYAFDNVSKFLGEGATIKDAVEDYVLSVQDLLEMSDDEYAYMSDEVQKEYNRLKTEWSER